MKLNTPIPISGCVTQQKYIAGRTATEIERNLGFSSGRLSNGFFIVALTRLPLNEEFKLQGYSQVASHKFKGTGDLEVDKLKGIARKSWNLSGGNRLVKILPTTRHDNTLSNDLQYPPGKGVPQWILTKKLPGKVVWAGDDSQASRIVPSQVKVLILG